MSGLGADVASFVAKLEQAYPEFRIVRPLLERRAPALLAFECIAHELVQATFHLPDAAVATSKLRWWREELARCAAGEARHPLTRSLHTMRRDRSDLSVFEILIDHAARGRDAPPPRDFTAQRAAVAPVFAAIEQLRIAALGTPETAARVQADFGVSTHLLRELARLPLADEVPESAVPMQLLARHQATRAALAEPGAARDAIAREQVADIGASLAALAPAIAAAAGWLVRVRWRCECRRASPLPAAEPFAVLWGRLERAPWNTAWVAWRALRREH